MDRYQLKNVIILILLLVNGFLLGSMAYRGTAARAARDRSVEQLVELFAADGMELFPGAIPDEEPPSGRVLTRDSALESSAAAPMSLTPVWHIVTDTVGYYVNCATGAVSQY